MLVGKFCLGIPTYSHSANANNWSEVSIIGFRTEMLLEEVLANHAARIPDTSIKRVQATYKNNQQQNIEYVSRIVFTEISPQRETTLTIDFLPPETADGQLQNSRAHTVNQHIRFKDRSAMSLVELQKSLMQNYGEPSDINPMRFSRVWTFKYNGNQVTASEIKDKRSACRVIRNKLDTYEAGSSKNNQTDKSQSSIIAELTPLRKRLRACENDFNRLLPCSVTSHKNYCPKSLQINWILTLNSQDHIR